MDDSYIKMALVPRVPQLHLLWRFYFAREEWMYVNYQRNLRSTLNGILALDPLADSFRNFRPSVDNLPVFCSNCTTLLGSCQGGALLPGCHNCNGLYRDCLYVSSIITAELGYPYQHRLVIEECCRVLATIGPRPGLRQDHYIFREGVWP